MATPKSSTKPAMTTHSFPPSRQWVVYMVFPALAALATWYMRLGPAAEALASYFGLIMEPKPFFFPDSDIQLRRTYVGIDALDTFLSFLVAAFLPGAAGLNKAFQLQQLHFLFSFLPVLATWSVEAARQGSAWKIISFTSFWSLFYQTVGGAIFIPLWYLAFLLTTSRTVYGANNSNHPVPLPQAKALIPALLIGYVVPTTLMYLPFLGIETQQFMVALWQPAPLFVNGLWAVGSWISAGTERPEQNKKNSEKYVKAVYLLSGVVSAIVHLGVMWTCLTSDNPAVNLGEVLVPVERSTWGMATSLLFVFQVDFWVIMAAGLVAAWVVVWDVHHLGLADVGTGKIVAVTIVVAVVLGPGAAISGVWYWREGKLRQAVPRGKR